MTSPTPSRATDGKQAGGQSRGLPQRTSLRQFIVRELREFAGVAALFLVFGVGGYLLFLASLQGAIG